MLKLSFIMGAFHAYDIRGIYNVDFNKEDAYKVGYFLPELLGADKVLVGRDCRVSSPEIHDYLIKGITDAGADVDDIGLSSTPLVYFGTANYGYKASVQITASHNPAEYNGMKVSRENALPVGLDTGLGQIKQWIEEGRPTPPAAKKGSVKQIDIKADYIAFLKKFKADFSNLKIAFDLSNGMANLFAKEVYKDEDATFLFDTLDGRFPNHEPNPLIPKNVEPLKKEVARIGADLGVIYDGDADRVMFVDDRSRFVAPDLIIAMMALYFCGERGEKNPRVLQEIRSSKAVGEYLLLQGFLLFGQRHAGEHHRAPHRLRPQKAGEDFQQPDRRTYTLQELRRDQFPCGRQGWSHGSGEKTFRAERKARCRHGLRRLQARIP